MRSWELLLVEFDQQLSALDQALYGLAQDLSASDQGVQPDERQQQPQENPLMRRLFVLAGLDPELLSTMMEQGEEDERSCDCDSGFDSSPFSFSDDYFDSDSNSDFDSTAGFFAGFNDYFTEDADNNADTCIDVETLRRRPALLVPVAEGLTKEHSEMRDPVEEHSEEWNDEELEADVEW